MEDLTFPIPGDAPMTDKQALHLNPLQLAYIGDAVYELYVRMDTILHSDSAVKALHRRSVGRVNAEAQAEALSRILPLLSEEEAGISRRARNTKTHAHRDMQAYHMATALEALVGYLYLTGRHERLNTLMQTALSEEKKED